jgi:hypothetical protein
MISVDRQHLSVKHLGLEKLAGLMALCGEFEEGTAGQSGTSAALAGCPPIFAIHRPAAPLLRSTQVGDDGLGWPFEIEWRYEAVILPHQVDDVSIMSPPTATGTFLIIDPTRIGDEVVAVASPLNERATDAKSL